MFFNLLFGDTAKYIYLHIQNGKRCTRHWENLLWDEDDGFYTFNFDSIYTFYIVEYV